MVATVGGGTVSWGFSGRVSCSQEASADIFRHILGKSLENTLRETLGQ